MIGVSDGSQFNDEFEAQIGGPITSTMPVGDSEKLAGEFNVDHGHHVPLVATALTKDGREMYGMAVDHRVPLEMDFNGSKHDITPFLYAHEGAELPVMHDLVKGGMDAKTAYGLAHDRVANPTEAASRFAYAAKNGLDPEEFNKAYYNHIKQASETSREPSDKARHPDGHTTRYGLDEAEGAYKVAGDVVNFPNQGRAQAIAKIMKMIPGSTREQVQQALDEAYKSGGTEAQVLPIQPK